jgi:hypothetical protein
LKKSSGAKLKDSRSPLKKKSILALDDAGRGWEKEKN